MTAVAMAFALDPGGGVAHALTASPSERFRCLLCSATLTRTRDGAWTYFRHAEPSRCDGSGVEREAARRLLAAWVERDLLAHGVVRWRSPCPEATGAHGEPPRVGRPASHAVPRWSAVRCDLHATTGYDVVVLRGEGQGKGGDAAVVFGFVLLADGHRPPALAPPRQAEAPVLWLRVDDVVRFRPLVPLPGTTVVEADAARAGCPPSATGAASNGAASDGAASHGAASDGAAQGARSRGAAAQGASAPSAFGQGVPGFLDPAFVAEAGRIQRAWDVVLAAASEEPRASVWRRLWGRLLVSTRRG